MRLLVTSLWFFSCDFLHVQAEVDENGHFRGLGPMNGDPNDELYYMQKSYLEAISIPEAWDILDSTAKRTPVTIAVIDDGIEATHPDLKGAVIKGYNVVDENDDTSPRGLHGTCMAGIIGAIRITTSVLRVFWTVSDSSGPQFIDDKIREATAAGMLVVVTAGHAHLDLDIYPDFPCSFDRSPTDGVICVAATDGSKMRLSDDSNFGSAVDIAAPGEGIVTTDLKGKYSQDTGTSVSAAIVAGIAGMLYSLEPSLKNKLAPADIKRIIKDTATQGLKDSKGEKTLPFGRVNAAAAVNKILEGKKV
ncbi:Subtilisin DY, putative [Perkinsus marinus ATCC 50983]|uniref:subtilisin n=1 Tax=Perkinsus marinus (strain ATCC 50983 / TXsc) TaxID=423536 RepID=C5LCC9_PERM5|nr:Subtilisin DY, putative [Perkinsus marinus ATCC 50983]EER05612.1 Subtilisin DY, putative [Perkinsus marinus ATCC 50983]|eukprot:XP_002773796.1 Subtilisin DY, putative [Perkinsus marinus ATCC 50983]